MVVEEKMVINSVMKRRGRWGSAVNDGVSEMRMERLMGERQRWNMRDREVKLSLLERSMGE